MKVVLLAGGLGTRMAEETETRPKPMVAIGDRPILWHIMKIYHAQGFKDFIICLGYKGFAIKEYFSNYALHTSDVTFDFQKSTVEYYSSRAEDWRVTLVDTGQETMTGGRLKRIAHLIDGRFLCTYGDGVANIDLRALIATHQAGGRLATLTIAQQPSRFGTVAIAGEQVTAFVEKPADGAGFINVGFFVLEPGVLDYIEGDHTSFENEPLQALARKGQLGAYRHNGFWRPMDTLRDKRQLEDYWSQGTAPWKIW